MEAELVVEKDSRSRLDGAAEERDPVEMYVFSVMPRETIEGVYCLAGVWELDDEIETLDLLRLETGLAVRYFSRSESSP